MILVLNCGSQSIKWKVFDDKLNTVKAGQGTVLEEELGKAKEFNIDLIGHRVVHGGGTFVSPTQITDENLIELEKLNNLAPLHNPFNILGIKTCQKFFVNKPNIAVFDTEFFSNLPEKAYTYALPEAINQQLGFKRYGFHGTSHEYVAKEAAKRIKKPYNKLNIITCHLGGGASVAAIKNGKAVDTSMGFTPLEGLVMMTRSGNVDPGIVLELAKEFGIDKANEILNKQSGIKGICGEDDMLKVLAKTESPEESQRRRVELALDMFAYSIQKYIGSYFAILGGCNALVFTGAIGFGSEKIRDMVCDGLNILKKTKILAIENNEELAIAQKIVSLK